MTWYDIQHVSNMTPCQTFPFCSTPWYTATCHVVCGTLIRMPKAIFFITCSFNPDTNAEKPYQPGIVEFSDSSDAQEEHNSAQGIMQLPEKRGGIWMYPGTKWCGAGRKAVNYTDLGERIETDRCCREHDLCPHKIKRFSTKYNYYNCRIHTLSHCDCDNR